VLFVSNERIDMTYFAVATTPDRDPPNPVGCDYQIQVSYAPDTYQCLTEQQYQTQQVQKAVASEAAWQTTKQNFAEHWWHIGLAIIAVFVLTGIISSLYEKWDKKRNPWEYDQYGNKWPGW
jgi:hypothetical protein